MRILVVEDERKVASFIRQGLEEEGHAVEVAADGAAALDLGLADPAFDLIVLDVMLPKRDGFAVLRTLREHGVRSPVLMLTARDAVGDKVAGLDAGADDYLAKPFELAELEARVRALMRRGGATGPLMTHGSLSYDVAGRVARLNGVPLELSARELNLLEIFLQRAGRLVSKEQLIDLLCEWGDEVSANAIEVYVHRLRRKLAPGGVQIATVRSAGYVLDKPRCEEKEKRPEA
jgi:two-component system, OmpR family, response regulator